MILDATLPPTSILEKFFPQVEIVSDAEVEMPYVRVRQFLGAPTSATKLWGTEKEREKNPDAGEGNRRAVRRFILQRFIEINGEQRWLESGRHPMVVICQEKYQEWLEESGLPEGIETEHYNAIAGLDDHKHVDCLISIGRTIPPPAEVEAYAGALTASEPLSETQTGRWYGRVPRGIRIADGTGIEVERCDEHCDPVAENVRYQICEAEVIQAIGRGRGVNRKAETPLHVDILADVVLPVTVDEVVRWEEPSEMVEMLAEDSAMLTGPTEMAKAYPRLWKTVDRAKWAVKKVSAGARARNSGWNPYRVLSSIGIPPSVPTHAVQYQRAGAKQKFHWAFFIPRKWPVARAWFEARGWAVVIREYLWPGQIKPMAGASSMGVDAAVAPAKLSPTAEVRALVDKLPLELIVRNRDAFQAEAFSAKMLRISTIEESLKKTAEEKTHAAS